MKPAPLAGLTILLLAAPAPADPTVIPPPPGTEVEFRIAAVTLKGTAGERCALADVRVKELGGRRFLVGTEVRPADAAPAVRLPTWVPLDDVGVLKEFADAWGAWEAAGGKVQADKVSGGSGSGSEITEWDSLTMKIPIDYNPTKRPDIKALRLLVSTDRGASWVQHTECGPDQTQFSYTAPKAGEYWFTMQVINKDVAKDPADGVFVAALKVRMKSPWVPRPRMEKARD